MATDPRAHVPDEPPRGRASASERAYAWVKERLLDGRFAGGTLLSENDISQRLGISRTPVRQAFVQLESERLLDLYPRRGALVVPVAASEADDVLEARLLIEQHCARRVAGMDLAPAGVLRASIAEQEQALAAGGAGFAQADREFHRAIVAANGNELLTRQFDTLRDRHQRIAATTVARDPTRIARFIREHREILTALERGESERAAESLASHLVGAHDLHRPLRERYAP